MKELVSIIVPCFNEEESLPPFYEEMSRVMNLLPDYDFEIIGINDGSKDQTLQILRELSLKDERVHYISFSRNFGKESAIYAGLKHAKGDYVAMMDADLQDPPSLLPQMLEEIHQDDIDSVATRRVNREGEPPIRSFFARLFYKLMNKISKTDIVDGARDYRLMSRQFVDSLLELSEYNRFSKGLFGWVGYNTKWIEFKNVERVAGETKWSFWKLFMYSIEGIVAFSIVPLYLAAIIGILFCFLAFVFIIIIVVRTLAFGDPVSGWPSMVCIILLLGGLQLLSIGILGEYLAKTYLETKHRPIYIIKESDQKDDK